MNGLTEELLHRYHDGDLDPAEAAEVERRISASPEARAILREIEAVGEAVRLVASARGEAAGDIAGNVVDRLARDAKGRAPRAAAGAGGGGRWLKLAPPLGLAVAAAAAAVVYLRQAPPRPVELARSAPPALSPSAHLAPVEHVASASPVLEEEPGAAIESVDFGGQNGTIFMVASGPQVTPVVWLMDEGDTGGDRMTPL